MRTLTDHVVDGDPAPQLGIVALDEPGPGGANHDYRISATYPKGVRSPIPNTLDDAVIHIDSSGAVTISLGRIRFQNGPIKEAGINGITQEALLAVVIDRLRSFQAGPFACESNFRAQILCEKALWHLQQRTRGRIARGVEGTNQK